LRFTAVVVEKFYLGNNTITVMMDANKNLTFVVTQGCRAGAGYAMAGCSCTAENPCYNRRLREQARS
jgi:hypothetical protein